MLPVVDRIVRDGYPRPPPGMPSVLILEPTRELANQIERELTKLDSRIQSVCCYGGSSINAQVNVLRRGVHVCIATPGRLMDLMERGEIQLNECNKVILDEADEMLRVGFKDDVDRIFSAAPANRQTILFSATVPHWIDGLIRRHTRDVVRVDCVGAAGQTPSLISHKAAAQPHHEHLPAMILSLAAAFAPHDRVMIFCEKKSLVDDTDRAVNALYQQTNNTRSNISAPLHGDIPQAARESTLRQFREGQLRILIATDVAARGIDVPDVKLVIQVGIPNEVASYVHRSGRTGRAGKVGTSVMLYHPSDRNKMAALSSDLGIRFSQVVASDLVAESNRVEKAFESMLKDIGQNLNKKKMFESLKAKTDNQTSTPEEEDDSSDRARSVEEYSYDFAKRLTERYKDREPLELLTATMVELFKHNVGKSVTTSFSILSSTPEYTTIAFSGPLPQMAAQLRIITGEHVHVISPVSFSKGTLADIPNRFLSSLQDFIDENGTSSPFVICPRLPAELFVGSAVGAPRDYRRERNNNSGGGAGGYRGGPSGGNNGYRSNYNNDYGRSDNRQYGHMNRSNSY